MREEKSTMVIHSTLVFTSAPENHSLVCHSHKRPKGCQTGDQLMFFLRHPYFKLPETEFPGHTQVTAARHRGLEASSSAHNESVGLSAGRRLLHLTMNPYRPLTWEFCSTCSQRQTEHTRHKTRCGTESKLQCLHPESSERGMLTCGFTLG